MAEHPILFSAPMVRAIMAGTKTQTRRVVNPRHRAQIDLSRGDRAAHWSKPMPYGQPGDRLWVRETWHDASSALHMCALYRANGEQEGIRWAPSIHMPRWASRITLEITGVRVQRLQNISEIDAVAEGVFQKVGATSVGDVVETVTGGQLIYVDPSQAREEYQRLWEQINGPDSWTQNPWVWVLDFKRA